MSALVFHIGICSVYLKAVPVLALLDTIIQRSSCSSYSGCCHGKQNGISHLALACVSICFSVSTIPERHNLKEEVFGFGSWF